MTKFWIRKYEKSAFHKRFLSLCGLFFDCVFFANVVALCADAEITQIQWYYSPKFNRILFEEETVELISLLQDLALCGDGEEKPPLIDGGGGCFYIAVADGSVFQITTRQDVTDRIWLNDTCYACESGAIVDKPEKINENMLDQLP